MPIKLANKKNPETLEFLHNLLNLTDFDTEVVKLREQCGIPKAGLPVKALIGKNLYSIGNLYLNSIQIIVNEFTKNTGLSEDYALQIALIVLYNSIVDIKNFKLSPEPRIEFVFGKENISNRMWKYNKEVGALIFPFQTSKTKIKEWLDENWDSVVTESSYNFTSNKFIQNVHKNILKEEDIKILKSEGKSISQIVEIFKKKYPNEKWYPSKIKKIHADEKQRIELQKLLNNRKTK